MAEEPAAVVSTEKSSNVVQNNMLLPLENQIKKHDVVERPEVVEDFDEIKTRTVIKKRKNR